MFPFLGHKYACGSGILGDKIASEGGVDLANFFFSQIVCLNFSYVSKFNCDLKYEM